MLVVAHPPGVVVTFKRARVCKTLKESWSGAVAVCVASLTAATPSNLVTATAVR